MKLEFDDAEIAYLDLVEAGAPHPSHTASFRVGRTWYLNNINGELATVDVYSGLVKILMEHI